MGRGRRVTAILAVALGFLVGPATAAAHLRTGTIAVDYAASVRRPDPPAYRAQIYQSDRALSLALEPGHVVILLGYLREPVFRLAAAGLWINAGSPTAAAAGLLRAPQLGTSSTPRWRLRRGQHVVVWHDARARRLPPGVARGAWRVPLIVDGQRTELTGELTRFPAPSPWPWVGMFALWVAGGAALALLRRRGLVRVAAIRLALIAAGASTVLAMAFALDTYASPGTWIEGFDELVFIAVGTGALIRGPESLRVPAAIGVGLVGLAAGLLNSAVFLHPIVLAVLPGTVIRLTVVVATGAGLTAAALGCSLYLDTAPTREASPDLGLQAAAVARPDRRPGGGRSGA